MKPPISVIEQLEQHARKTKYTIFFVAALFCCFVVIAAGFKVIGWQAGQAEQKERQQYEQKIEIEKQRSELKAKLDRLVPGTRVEYGDDGKVKRMIFPPGSGFEYKDGRVRYKGK